MKTRSKSSPKKSAAVRSSHPLIGVWIEEDDPIYTSPVIYTIAAKEGRLSLSAVDDSDGVALRISKISWDGERLCFLSLFPPTKHKASHVISLIRKGRAAHQVSYSDEDGNHTVSEVWIKVANSDRSGVEKSDKKKSG